MNPETDTVTFLFSGLRLEWNGATSALRNLSAGTDPDLDDPDLVELMEDQLRRYASTHIAAVDAVKKVADMAGMPVTIVETRSAPDEPLPEDAES